MSVTQVAVVGAYGRMGEAISAAVDAAGDLALLARIGSGDNLDALAEADVAVDVTRPDQVLATLRRAVGLGTHVVVGTSGMAGAGLDEVRDLLADNPSIGVLVAPNFSVGAVLAMRFAAQAATHFESVEVVEMHHPDKVDAPSGTARRTAQLIAAAREQAGLGPVRDATGDDGAAARGLDVDGIAVHALRVRGLTASQEVLLGGVGETLSIRHDSHDRASFMPGVLAAVRAVPSMPGLTVGLDAVLGL